MRKLFIIAMVVVFSGGLFLCSCGENLTENIGLEFKVGESEYLSNGETKVMDGEVKEIDGKFYIPYNVLPEELSCAAKWVWNDDKKREVIITNHTNYFHFVEGESGVIVDGNEKHDDEKEDIKALINVSGKSYIPIIFAAELLGSKSINISHKNYTGDIETSIELVFDKPTDDREIYYERKIRLTAKPSNIEIDDEKTEFISNFLDYDGKKYLPIEDVLSVFDFITSWEDTDKLVFYRWNYERPKSERELVGFYLLGKNSLVIDDTNISLASESIMRDGKMYVTPDGFYKINPMTNIHWSAGDVKLWMWIPKFLEND